MPIWYGTRQACPLQLMGNEPDVQTSNYVPLDQIFHQSHRVRNLNDCGLDDLRGVLEYQIWGEEPVKRLSIPAYIDNYNHQMNGVDLADQLRSYDSPERHVFRTWRPLFDFLLQATIVNASILWISGGNEKTKTSGAFKFRKLLANQLLSHIKTPNWTQLPSFSKEPSRQHRQHDSDVQRIQNTCNGQHKSIFTSVKQCTSCKAFGATEVDQKPSQKRQFGELSSSEINQRSLKRQRPPRTLYGCSSCQIAICNNLKMLAISYKKMRGFSDGLAEKIVFVEGWLLGLF
jgi:hypothetical protein